MVEPSAGADEEELQKERSQPKSSKTSNTNEGSGAEGFSKNTRAQEMASRRQELEQSVSRVKTNSRQRSEDTTHKSTKKDTKEVKAKEKRRKSSKTAAEVKCRKETAMELPAQEKNAVVESEQDECEQEVEKEESVQPSSAKDVDKSDNHGVPIELRSNEEDNSHLVPNLEFEERNGAMAMSVIAKESD